MASKTNPIPLDVPTSAGVLYNYLVALSKAVYQLWARVNSPVNVTPSGATGDQTINFRSGSVNFAAAASTLTVTNSLVTADSAILATVGSNDATLKTVSVVAGAGSFVIYANAAASAETRVNWMVL